MIAVAVIGILAAVALPAYQNYIARANIDSCIKLITPARMTADSIIQNNGGSAATIGDATDIGLPDGNQPAGSDCDNVNVSNQDGGNNGDININATVRGNTMSWQRDGSNGIWACDTTAGDNALAPQTCP